MKTLLRLLLLIALLPLLAWADEPVRIGVLATRPKPMILAQWQPLAEKLKQRIPGRDFVIETLTFAEFEAAVASRNIDFVLTNPGDYVLLSQRHGLSSPLATLIPLAEGQPQYAFGGVIFTLSSRDDIKRLEDVRGKRVAMIGFESLGAYQMQAYELALKDVTLPQDAQLTATGMPHDKVVQAVLNGEVDVGFVRTGILEAMSREGRLDLSRLRVLNQQDLPGLPWMLSTRLYPEWPFAAMPQVNKALASDVASVLFQLHEDPALTRRIGIYGFTIPADYRVVENLLRKLRLPPFDAEPEFTWQDVWHRYRGWIIASVLATGAILLLLLIVWRSRQHLKEERILVLREAKRYEALLKTAGDGIHILDLEGNVLEANDAFCKMLGCTRDEMRSMNVTQWDVQTPSEELVSGMRELGEGSLTIETRHRRCDGSVIDVEVSISGVEIGGKRMLFCASRDITQRKQNEKALAEKEYRHRMLIENSPFCIHEIDLDGRLQSMNQAGLDMLGLSDEREVIGLPYMGAVGKQDAARIKALLDDAIRGTASHFQFVSSGESARYFKSCFIPIKDAGGVVVKLMGITEDISERKLAEDALRRSEELFRAMTDTSPLAIYMSEGIEQRAQYINPTFTRLFGYTMEEVPTVAEWWPRAYPDAAYREQVAQEWQRRAARAIEMHSAIEPMEAIVACKDGSRKYISWGFTSIGDQNWAFGLDLTEREQAAEELRKATAFAETLIDSLPGIFFRIDADGQLVGWNRMLEILLGDEGLEQAQVSALNIIHQDDRPAVAACLREGFDHGYSDVEARLVLKNGKTPWFYLVGRSLALGERVYLIGSGVDIDERKAAEEALRHSNADLEQFAYSVSHDMRAPLRVVSGHLQLLQRGLKDKLDDDDRENLAFALDGAKRMDAMIVSLLEYSRVGRIADEQSELPAREPFDEAMDFLAPMIRESHAEITATGEWPEIYASRDELTRLFQNLIGNALHYREKGSSPRIEVMSSVSGTAWRVSVRDYGIGIAPEQIERLFKFFSRLHARSRFEGTGMGLALCRRIVERHHGRIWVESEGEGHGSTFIFEMPLKPESMEGVK